jgi:hypothetical protein
MRFLILLLIITASATACGGDDDDVEPSTSKSAAVSATTTVEPVLAGEVSEDWQAIEDIALVDGRDASNDMDLYVGSRIETKMPGIVAFRLDSEGSEILACDVRQDSLLEIGPTNGLLVHWFSENTAGQTGVTWCAKPLIAGQQKYGVGSKVTITMTDPIFGVSVTGDIATIKVAQGEVTVSIDGGNDLVIVAGEQIKIGPDGAPKMQALELSDSDREAILGLQELSPLPDLFVEIADYEEDIANERCILSYTVGNQGRGAARASTTLVEVGDRRAEQETAALEPDETVDLLTAVPGSCPYGDEHGAAAADIDSVVVETDEDNNTGDLYVPPVF